MNKNIMILRVVIFFISLSLVSSLFFTLLLGNVSAATECDHRLKEVTLSSDSSHSQEPLTLSDLTEGADFVVAGTVLALDSAWNSDRTKIFTIVRLSVEESLKGTTNQSDIRIIVPGGEVDGIGELVSGAPRFTLGERACVFLSEKSIENTNLSNCITNHVSERVFEVYRGIRGKYSLTDSTIQTDGDEPTLLSVESMISSSSFSYSYDGYCWPNRPAVVSYRINENTPDCIGEGAAIQAAASTWSAAGAYFTFSYGGTTGAASGSQNFINEITWTNLGGDGTIALATYWYLQGTTTIIECDMEFNNNYGWSTTGDPTKYDVQTIALHEFGHFLSLGDLYDPADSSKVMYGYGSPGAIKRTLHNDDITGIKAIYGAIPTPPTISNSSGANNVTASSARLNGNLTSNGDENPSVLVYWGSSDGGTSAGSWQNVVNLGTLPVGSFYRDVSSLSPKTNYYYRCYATNSAGASWASSTSQFTTLANLPTVTNGIEASHVTHASAILNGLVASTGGENPTVRIYWGDNNGGTTQENWDNVVNLGNRPQGTFNTTVNALSSNTQYYYRCHVSNSAGSNWSPNTSLFTTVEARTLTMSIDGSGTISPLVGDHVYDIGTTINISATPNAGWRFSGWTGDTDSIEDINSGNTTIIVDNDILVTANFIQIFSLEIQRNGEGTISPSEGTHIYDTGTIISIIATADDGWRFTGWTDDIDTITDSSSDNTTIVMNGNYLITANFVESHNLNMAVSGNGIVSPVAGIHSFTKGTSVPLSAIPADGWRFVGWTGDVEALTEFPITTAPNASIVMDDDYSLTAVFDRPILEMDKEGNGTLSPTSGQHPYEIGSVVPIVATPDANWVFSHWSYLPADIFASHLPTGAGSETGIDTQFPDEGEHWQKVSDPGGDEAAYLENRTGGPGSEQRDLFTISDLSAPFSTKQITSVSVFLKSKAGSPPIKASIKTYGQVFDSPALPVPADNPEVHYTWYLNPVTDNTWTLDEVNALEIGVVLPGSEGPGFTFCTKVSARIDSVAPMIANRDSASTNVTMTDLNCTVTANFVRTHSTLTLETDGNGSVTGAGTYVVGATVDITATPDTGWQFSAWTGDTGAMADAGAASTNITMNSDYSITAVFTEIPPPPPAGGGGGGGGGAVGVLGLSDKTNQEGTLLTEARAFSEGSEAFLIMPGGTNITVDGQPVSFIGVLMPNANDFVPGPPENTLLTSRVFKFVPEGATFDPPIRLTFNFKTRDLPPDVDPSSLYIAWWDPVNEVWVRMDSEVEIEKNRVFVEISHFSMYAVFSDTASADVSISQVDTQWEAEFAGDLRVLVTVENSGDLAGETTLTLLVDGQTVETRTVSVGGTSSLVSEFIIPGLSPGEHIINLNGIDYPVTIIKALQPASFEVTGLDLSPAEVEAGEDVAVSVTVVNAGEAKGTYQLELRLNTDRIETRSVSIAGGESKEISFTVTSDKPGKNLVQVGNKISSFTVEGEIQQQQEPPPLLLESTTSVPEGTTASAVGTVEKDGFNWILVIAGFLGVLLVGGIVAFSVKRRKTT